MGNVDLRETVAAFLGAFEEVFERDWEYAKVMLSPANIDSFVAQSRSGGVEAWNWTRTRSTRRFSPCSTRDCTTARAWKGFDRDAMDRLYQQGYITDPRGKAKSVLF